MSSQIMFFEKNKIDLEYTNPSITITDAVASNTGQSVVNYMRDRKNYTAWMTTDSTDAANTQIDISLGDQRSISRIIIVGHNLKAYTIQYKVGAGSYQNFSTSIAETNDTRTVSYFTFNAVEATDLRIIITGTQVANADKKICQFIVTNLVGQFEGWPQIKTPKIDTSKRSTKMLSGKMRIVESLEAFSCKLDVKAWKSQGDLSLVETIYSKRNGVLMWINANDTDQFDLELKAYRSQDIFLVRPVDDYEPEFLSGVYVNPVKQSISLAEVIN